MSIFKNNSNNFKSGSLALLAENRRIREASSSILSSLVKDLKQALESWQETNMPDPSKEEPLNNVTLEAYRTYSAIFSDFSTLATNVVTVPLGMDDHSPEFASKINIANTYDYAFNTQVGRLAAYMATQGPIVLEKLDLEKLKFYERQLRGILSDRQQDLLHN